MPTVRTTIATTTCLAFVTAGAFTPVAGAAEGLDHARLAGTAVGERVQIDGLHLDEGVTVDLRLERFDVLTPGAPVVAMIDGAAARLAPDVVLLGGTVAGEPESIVFVGVSRGGTQGFVARAGSLHFLSTGPYRGRAARDFELAVTNASDLRAPAGDFECGTDAGRDDLFPFGRPAPAEGRAGLFPDPPGGASAGSAPCRGVRIAIDTDWEFTGNLFGGDTDASADYALFLAGAVSEIYRRDFNARLFVSYLRVWSANDDPYDAGSTGEALDQLRNWWRANGGGVDRELVHLFSGAALGGGVAYVAVVCSTQWGYAVSANLGGSFPYPLRDNDHGNWDPYVVAHETGHNFGTLHTHDGYDPPIDGCGLGDCENADQGTIMSYCHGCPGGMSNIRLLFHPRVIEVVLGYLDGVPCEIGQSGVVAADDRADTWEGNPVTIDILLNDEHASCDGFAVELESFDAVSDEGGAVTLVPAGGENPRDRLAYAPPGEFAGADAFGYRLVGGAVARVDVDVDPLRDADETGATEAGAFVHYYELDAPQQLPDFDALEPYATDVVPDVDYASTAGNFATSGRRTEVGAVFEGFVTVPGDGPYTFYTESDDGSALYVGDDRVVANDGVHGMRERGGAALLRAGPHAVRIEFFNNLGGSGLIASVEGPGLEKQPIAPEAWSHGVCAADLDSSGAVDFGDVLAILSAWGNAGGPEDLDGSGVVDFGDVLVVLSAWGPCA